MLITKIEKKEKKQDKNGKWYTPCVAEFEGATGGHWHNIYLSTDVVNLWGVGDDVEVRLKNDGKWKNFDPIITKDTKRVAPQTLTSTDTTLNQILTRLTNLEGRMTGVENELNKKDVPF